jgi:predicted aspartyl protease
VLALSQKPFHESKYRLFSNILRPFLKVRCRIENCDYLFEALADTGCDSGFVLLKGSTKGMKLGEKKNNLPVEVGVADGHVIGADVYFIKAEIGGEEREVELFVVDPKKIIGEAKLEESTPLIGREFLDNFDVTFHGRKKKLSLSLV